MSDVRHDPSTQPHEAGDAAERARADEGRDGRGTQRLAHVLREARERAGLGLSDVAEVTHVRRAYLDALEGGRYAELPEDVYTRNFLRLYAQAVRLDVDAVVELYLRERRTAVGLTTLEQRLERDRRTARSVTAGPSRGAGPRRSGPPAWLLGPWLPTVVLVAIVVAIGLWGFNQLLAPPTVRSADGDGAAATAEAAAPEATGEAGAAGEADAASATGALDAAAEPALEVAPAGGLAAPTLSGPGGAGSLAPVRVDVVTTPPGANVTIDGFPIPGQTPLAGIPVTGRAGRVVRAELDGYETLEVTADLSSDARVELVLTPIGGAAAAAGETLSAAAAGDADGEIVITVSDTTWLEVYRSTERNVGERLVYTTAQDGARYTFAAPVYVYVGNAAGVRIVRGGQDLGPMGSPGAVLGRAFPE